MTKENLLILKGDCNLGKCSQSQKWQAKAEWFIIAEQVSMNDPLLHLKPSLKTRSGQEQLYTRGSFGQRKNRWILPHQCQ